MIDEQIPSENEFRFFSSHFFKSQFNQLTTLSLLSHTHSTTFGLTNTNRNIDVEIENGNN